MTEIDAQPSDFIREIVAADLKAGKNDGRVMTRFPPRALLVYNLTSSYPNCCQ